MIDKIQNKVLSFYEHQKFFYQNILIYLIPISILLGPAALNIISIIISLIFIFDIINKKNFKIFEKKWIKVFFLFWIYICINSLFATDVLSALKSSFGQVRFLIILCFVYEYFDIKFLKNFIFLLFFLVLFVVIDNNIQYFTALDLFGYPAEGYNYPVRLWNLEEYFAVNNINRTMDDAIIGRLSGPFGDELVSGAFIAKLSLPAIIYFFLKLSKKNLLKNLFILLLIVFIFQGILITGERSSTIIALFGFAFFLFFFTSRKNIFIIILSGSISLGSLVSTNEFLKTRVNDLVFIVFNFEKSSYGRLIDSAIKVWKSKPITGVGLKNYRVDCKKLKDPLPSHQYQYCSNHPHNVFFQLLSETGLIGTILFFYFIFLYSRDFFVHFNNLKNNIKFYLLGFYITAVSCLIPIIPSGSIFSSWAASFIWINLAFASLIYRDEQFKN